MGLAKIRPTRFEARGSRRQAQERTGSSTLWVGQNGSGEEHIWNAIKTIRIGRKRSCDIRAPGVPSHRNIRYDLQVKPGDRSVKSQG